MLAYHVQISFIGSDNDIITYRMAGDVLEQFLSWLYDTGNDAPFAFSGGDNNTFYFFRNSIALVNVIEL